MDASDLPSIGNGLCAKDASRSSRGALVVLHSGGVSSGETAPRAWGALSGKGTEYKLLN